MRLRFDLEWRTSLLTLVLLPLLVSLGFWQLERADEKRAIAALNAERASASPVTLTELARLGPEELAYRRVRVSGRFLPGAMVFLDNQIRDGRYGHDALGLFEDRDSAQLALINRGWVAGDPARRSLPELDIPVEFLSLEARVYVPPGQPYLLAQDSFEELAWPLLVQDANAHALREAIEASTGQELFPRELRLAPDQPVGFRRDWPVVNVSPEKHHGYAVQWFTMAAVLFLFAVFRSSNLLSLIRRTGDADSEEQ